MNAYSVQDNSKETGAVALLAAVASAGEAAAKPAHNRNSGAARTASEKQLVANRANARRSSGPRTKEGKARVSQNAVKHGLRGRFQLIVGEDAEDYRQFHDDLHLQFHPQGAVETELAERAIGGFWRLRRIQRMESEMTDKVLEDAVREKRDHSYRSLSTPVESIFGTELSSPEWNLDAISLGEAVMRQIPVCDVIGSLQRYEAHVERGLYKALHELQRLQAARQGQAMAVPVAVDVTIDRAADGTAPAVKSVELPNKAIRGDGATPDGSGTERVPAPCGVVATEPSPASMNGPRCDAGLPQRTGITEQSQLGVDSGDPDHTAERPSRGATSSFNPETPVSRE